MADTLVRGLKIPTNCAACTFRLGWCRERIYMETRPKRCPLYEVPKHGRLIDADSFRADWLYNGANEYVYDTNSVLDSIDNAPTVIPADIGKVFEKFFDKDNDKDINVPCKTNADRIRAMTDEELVKFHVHTCPPPYRYGGSEDCPDDDCIECWRTWLKEEVKDDTRIQSVL